MKYVSTSLEDTENIARQFLETLNIGERATVVALQGNLGAGKTAFTQAVGKILGVEESLLSPTFVIMKIYAILWRGFKNLVHIDAYRLEQEKELTHLGWENMIKEPENLIFIEWPENVPGAIPGHAHVIKFEFIDENTREIQF